MANDTLQPMNRALEILLRFVKTRKQKDVAAEIAREAEKLGRTGPPFSAMQLSHILKRRRSPCLLVACAIEVVAGINPRLWFDNPKHDDGGSYE